MKKVSRANVIVMSINDVSDEKIYAFRNVADLIYKLHCVTEEGDRFAFISMDDSYCWAQEEEHPSMKEAIQAQTADVFEFDSLKEFCMWCLK